MKQLWAATERLKPQPEPGPEAEWPPARPMIYGAVIVGAEARLLEIEASWAQGKGRVQIAADLNRYTRASPKRIAQALAHSGHPIGDGYDWTITARGLEGEVFPRSAELAAALAIATANGAYTGPDVLAHGGLQHDGAVVPVPGAVAAAALANKQPLRWLGHEKSAPLAFLATREEIRVCITFREVLNEHGYEWYPDAFDDDEPEPAIDMADILCQPTMKFGAEVAAAGRHHLLLAGLPGMGKTLLAKAMIDLFPPMSLSEQLELAQVADSYGFAPSDSRRPFVETGRGISLQAFLGSGSGGELRPGLVTRAHNGVLFVDEFPLLGGTCVEGLREPLEAGIVRVQRAGVAAIFPARFLLVAAMNDCPCGPEPSSDCICTPTIKRSYLRRISGPIFDRFTIRVRAETIRYRQMEQARRGESTATIRERVRQVHGRQAQRYADEDWRYNADLPQKALDAYVPLGPAVKAELARANPTPRRLHRLRVVARTIADLKGNDEVDTSHIRAALSLTQGGTSLCRL